MAKDDNSEIGKNLNSLREIREFLDLIGKQENLAIIMALYEKPSIWFSYPDIRKMVHERYGIPFISEDQIRVLQKEGLIIATDYGLEKMKETKYLLSADARGMIGYSRVMLEPKQE